MKLKIFLILFLFIITPLIYAEVYGENVYSAEIFEGGDYCGDLICNNAETCSNCSIDCGLCTETSTDLNKKTSSTTEEMKKECTINSNCNANEYCLNYSCYYAECFNDSYCDSENGEICINYECEKPFDIKIIKFDSSAKLGEFFNFTYTIETIKEIEGNVSINFWIEQDGNIIASGQDKMHIKSPEKITKMGTFLLPKEITKTGIYEFYIKLSYDAYNVSIHNRIEIIVDEEGIATIDIISKYGNIVFYIITGMVILSILIVITIYYAERKKVRMEQFFEMKGIKEHKFSILVSIILFILLVLIYIFRWYEFIAKLIKG